MKRNVINKLVRRLCAGGDEVLDALEFVVLARNNMERNGGTRSELAFADAMEDKLNAAASAMRDQVAEWRRESGLLWSEFIAQNQD